MTAMVVLKKTIIKTTTTNLMTAVKIFETPMTLIIHTIFTNRTMRVPRANGGYHGGDRSRSNARESHPKFMNLSPNLTTHLNLTMKILSK